MKLKLCTIICCILVFPLCVESIDLNNNISKRFIPLEKDSKEIIELKENLNNDLNSEWLDRNGNLLPIYKITNNYVKTVTYFDKNGTASLLEETTISKNEFNNEYSRNTVNSKNLKASLISCDSLDTYKDCIETNYKVLTLAFLGNPTYPNLKIAVVNRWKKLPKIRSYDVIGLLMESPTFKMSTAYGYQYYNESSVSGSLRINYSYKGTNMKLYKDDSKNELGVSISQNILDSAYSLLRNELYLTGTDHPTTIDVFGVAASYQHAIEDISLEDSKNFDFHLNGMGRVFKWKNNSQYWDNMEGVCGRIDSTNLLWMC